MRYLDFPARVYEERTQPRKNPEEGGDFSVRFGVVIFG